MLYGWLTCGGSDGGGQAGGSQHGDTLVILGVASLDGSQVAVTPGAEAAGQVQGIHGLRLHLAKDGLTH